MKKLITLLMLSMSATIFASVQDLTKEEYLGLLKENEETFLEVRPGMKTEFFESYSISTEDDKAHFCEVRAEEVVMATSPSHYLVYYKEEMMKNCAFLIKGTTRERLSWRKIHTVEAEDKFITNNLTQYKIQQIDDELVRIIGKVKYPDSTVELPYAKIKNLKKSQVSSIQFFDDSESKYVQYWIEEVDPSSIDIRNLLNGSPY